VRRREQRKLKARREKDRSVWFGLGVFGIVGWSVVIPTLAGIALGVWIDTRSDSPYAWTLMLLFVGLAVGCLNAWYWVRQESRHD
jgi:ATP synthase protein I